MAMMMTAPRPPLMAANPMPDYSRRARCAMLGNDGAHVMYCCVYIIVWIYFYFTSR